VGRADSDAVSRRGALDDTMPAPSKGKRHPSMNDSRFDHDLDLVEEITRRVLERLGAPAASAASHGALLRFVGEGDCEPCTVRGRCAERCPNLVRAFIDCGAARVSMRPGAVAHPSELAPFIDHTLLKADATADEIETLCREAREHRFASVCVNPAWVRRASDLLSGAGVLVCSVIGFPLGASHPDAKAFEARRAIADGAGELDMVIQIGALKSHDHRLVERDIRGVVEAARCRAAVKVIIETALLTRDEKVAACTLAKAAGADFVKTSTGFAAAGATVEDVRLMREVVGQEMGVKAAGGIRDPETAMALVAAGATRIGASASVKIIKGAKREPAEAGSGPRKGY
jgi:deoxyribose-phosphate aldolase